LLTGRKLLLADDSLTIQKVVSLTFIDEAMEVTTVGGGAEAVAKLGESLPDIVLADVFMPEPNGYALCERIKTDERTRHIPVVLLVGTFEPFNEAEARRVGADEVLTKPFQSIRDLVNKVGGLLGGQPGEKTPDAEHAHDEHRDADEATRDLSPFAATARAADPAADTAPPPADPFTDFDMDDATIQTTPAAAFDAHYTPPPSGFSEINVEEQFSDRGETDEAFVLGDDDDAPAPEVYAATAATASAPTASRAAAPVAESAFDAHATRAIEADDALLELGDVAPASRATAEADDFILDMGDEDSFDSVFAPAHDASAEAETDMFFAEHAQTTEAPEAFSLPPTASAEPEAPSQSQTVFASQSPDEAEMWASPAVADAEAGRAPDLLADELELDMPEMADAPEITDVPSLLFANEPQAPDAFAAESFRTPEADSPAQPAPAWDGDPVAASMVAHAGVVAASVASSGESRGAETDVAEASSARSAFEASSPAASSEPGQAASTAAASLSPEMMDELVRRVVAHMSERVVREIAWEVVPDLAERLIRQHLEEEQTRSR
jgi:CheY-like chemotaxis protein